MDWADFSCVRKKCSSSRNWMHGHQQKGIDVKKRIRRYQNCAKWERAKKLDRIKRLFSEIGRCWKVKKQNLYREMNSKHVQLIGKGTPNSTTPKSISATPWEKYERMFLVPPVQRGPLFNGPSGTKKNSLNLSSTKYSAATNGCLNGCSFLRGHWYIHW